jgi:hypothetical protein
MTLAVEAAGTQFSQHKLGIFMKIMYHFAPESRTIFMLVNTLTAARASAFLRVNFIMKIYLRHSTKMFLIEKINFFFFWGKTRLIG